MKIYLMRIHLYAHEEYENFKVLLGFKQTKLI